MNLLEQFFWDNQVDEVINDSIEAVFQSFDDRLRQLEEEKLEVSKVTRLAMLKLEALVHLATIEYDGFTTQEEALEKLDPDGEPYPNKVDSWARGMVATRKVVTEDNSFRRTIPAASGTPSVSSFRSSATGRSRTTTGNKSHRSVHSRQSERDKKAGQIVELEDEMDGDFNDFGATGQMFNLLEKQKNKKTKGFLAATEGVKSEFDIMEEQLAKAAKEARGKKFVLDRYGQTVIVGKVDPANLPPFNASLQAAVKEENQVKGSKGASRDGVEGDKKKRFVRVAGSRGVEESLFQPNLSLASTLSGMDRIQKLNPGVTIKSKVGEKAGDPIPEDSRKISMKTYLSKTTALQPAMSDISNYDSFPGPFSNSQAVDTGRQTNRGTKDRDGRQELKNIDSLPEIDPFEGSKIINPPSKTLDLSDDDLGLGETSTNGRSPNSRLPKKPNGKHRSVVDMIVNSPEGGKPRDRDLVKNMKAVADRKHLAAPPLGMVAGHGLGAVTESGLNSSVVSGSVDTGSYSSEWFQRRKK